MSQRFSDAELAAEYWHAMYQRRIAKEISTAFSSPTQLKQRDREVIILHRFATLPHAHETNLVNETTKDKP